MSPTITEEDTDEIMSSIRTNGSTVGGTSSPSSATASSYKKHRTTSDYSTILDKIKYSADLSPVTSYYKPILKYTFGKKFDSDKVCDFFKRFYSYQIILSLYFIYKFRLKMELIRKRLRSLVVPQRLTLV